MPVVLSQLVCAGAFVAGLAAAVGLSHAVVPADEVTDIERKESWMRLAERTPDVVFFGSSRTYRAVIPERFDAVCAAAGQSLESRNQGVVGVTALGIDLMTRDALETRPGIRVAVIELRWWAVGIAEVDRMTYRAIRRHSIHGTRLALETLDRSGWGEAEVEEMRGIHIQHFLHRWFRPGRWQTWWGMFGIGDTEIANHVVNERAGYRPPLVEDSESLRRRRARFRPDAHDRFVSRSWAVLESQILEGREDKITPQDWTDAVALRQLQDDLEARGVLPIFVMYPISTPRPLILRDAREVGLRHVIDLNRPDLYPELFDSENRFDRGHLDENGAEFATDVLAREILRVFEEEGVAFEAPGGGRER